MWMLFVLLYGVLKGAREVAKKKSLERSTTMEVLFFYTLFSFLLVCPDMKNAMGVPPVMMLFIALKSFVIFLAWIFSFKAIKTLPLSLYGVLDLSRVLFSTLIAVVVIHETLTPNSIIGLLLVGTGLLLLKAQKKTGIQDKAAPLMVICAFASCILNAVSGTMDKLLMRTLNSSQLQFWYLLFLVSFYFLYILFTRTRIRVKESLKNPMIWLLAIMFVIADRALFIANQDPNSRVSIMTLIKQSGAIVTILSGRFIFKEKNTTHKLICAGVIIAGIVVSVL